MNLKIFVDVPKVSASIHIDLLDCDVDGSAVWRVRNGAEEVFIEGNIKDDVWLIVDRAAKAYEEEK